MSGRINAGTVSATIEARELRLHADHERNFMRRPEMAKACEYYADLIDALAAERDRLAAELAAERAERKAERLASLEEIVREHGMNVDDELVDSCANSTVYRAMLDLADAGRMTIEPGGVGRRIYGRWVVS